MEIHNVAILGGNGTIGSLMGAIIAGFGFRQYLDDVLMRTTIVSKDAPAFIANRIGFKLMNDLLILVKQYEDKGGINYIDSLFTGYTVRNMKPLATIDFYGSKPINPSGGLIGVGHPVRCYWC